ncbi:Ras- protein Rab-33B [Homalodisca vitripennis]|nr:Ras- protein Rab-33B [Homalodisca vitripennis]
MACDAAYAYRRIRFIQLFNYLQLWDTAGQERFRKSMVHHYYRNAHAVVIVYDVTKLSTFQSLPLWLEECEKHNLTNQVPRILVGNKCDCRESVAVNTNLAQRIADAHNMPGYNLDSRNWTSLDYKPHTFLIWTPGRQSWFLTGSKSPVNGLVNVEGIKIILVEENQFKQVEKYFLPVPT